MNIFVRFGQWLENRRVIRKPEFDVIENAVFNILSRLESLERFERSMDGIKDQSESSWEKIKSIEQANQSPTALVEIQKDLAVINARLNKIELYIGLQREPKAVQVEGAAKIS